MTQDFETISVEVDEDVFNLYIGHEENYGALSPEAFLEIEEALDMATANESVRVIVLQGQGENFSSGGDIDVLKNRLENPTEYWAEKLLHKYDGLRPLLNCPKPIVGKIEGYATGSGATLATTCDISVASEDAMIGDLHLNMAFSAPDSPALWPFLIGINKTKELIMTGEMLTGSEAADLGLLNHAVPAEELDEKVEEIVHKLASGPQIAIYYNKMMVNKWLKWALLFAGDEGFAHEAMTGHTSDHEHAVHAFFDDSLDDGFPSGR